MRYISMEYIDGIHIRILDMLYAKWPCSATGDEIIHHVHSRHNSSFDPNNLTEYMMELENIGQVNEGSHPSGQSVNDTHYYLTPTMYLAMYENIKQPDSIFSEMS